MRAFIAGCGRTGAGLAERLAGAGHEVTIIDTNTEAFNRLDHGFSGRALRADVTDEDQLRRAGAEGVDLFFALTEGDNRNVLAAQSASETLGIERVVAKVNDPVRAEAYRSLGIATLCRTRLLIDDLATYAGLPHDPGADGVAPATGHHLDHEEPAVRVPAADVAAPAGGR
ncbi:MAG: TrkA family potassium uptake protein [Chloroflexi bacterium]|nr:TrkA family potassium uptake protein [Chloroflexota bacterium]MDQ3448013.1 TrkA family potassium uptake protein [Chloroflexota bacterium]